MEEKYRIISTGPGISTLLGIVFITLKLCRIIDWGWIWVLAPFWIPWSIFLIFLVLLIITLLIIKLFNPKYIDNLRKQRKSKKLFKSFSGLKY